MLSNQLPEDGLARAMGDAELTAVTQYNPKVSENLARIIEKAMAVQPENRYQNSEDFKQALESLIPPIKESFDKTNISQSAATMYSGQVSNQTVTSQAPLVGATVQSSQPVQGVYPQGFNNSPGQPQPVYTQNPPSTPLQPAKKTLPIFAGIVIGIAALAICGIIGFFAWNSSRAQKTEGIVQPSQANSNPVAVISSAVPQAVDTATQEPTATAAPTLTSEPTLTFTPSVTPVGGGGGKIAFASDREGLPQIFLMNSDGTNVLKITDLQDGACQPDWSPDGMKLVFISPCKERKDTYKGSGLFIANADGTGVNPLITIPGGDYEPDWSPDGNRIAFTSLRDGISHIYLYNLQDNTATLLSAPTSNDRRAEWSPDGTKIAFETTRLGNSQVWVMSDSGKGAREFANLNNGASYMPTWSSSGQFITFVQGTDQPWLTSRQYNSPTAPEIKLQDLRSLWNPQYSWDSFWFTFEYIQDGNLDIYRMTTNGVFFTRLNDVSGSSFNPAWQPFGN